MRDFLGSGSPFFGLTFAAYTVGELLGWYRMSLWTAAPLLAGLFLLHAWALTPPRS